MASRLPALVFQRVPGRVWGSGLGASTGAQDAENAESPNWSSAGLGSRLLLLAVLLGEVVAVTLAIAGEVGALQA